MRPAYHNEFVVRIASMHQTGPSSDRNQDSPLAAEMARFWHSPRGALTFMSRRTCDREKEPNFSEVRKLPEFKGFGEGFVASLIKIFETKSKNDLIIPTNDNVHGEKAGPSPNAMSAISSESPPRSFDDIPQMQYPAEAGPTPSILLRRKPNSQNHQKRFQQFVIGEEQRGTPFEQSVGCNVCSVEEPHDSRPEGKRGLQNRIPFGAGVYHEVEETHSVPNCLAHIASSPVTVGPTMKEKPKLHESKNGQALNPRQSIDPTQSTRTRVINHKSGSKLRRSRTKTAKALKSMLEFMRLRDEAVKNFEKLEDIKVEESYDTETFRFADPAELYRGKEVKLKNKTETRGGSQDGIQSWRDRSTGKWSSPDSLNKKWTEIWEKYGGEEIDLRKKVEEETAMKENRNNNNPKRKRRVYGLEKLLRLTKGKNKKVYPKEEVWYKMSEQYQIS
ncbi:hypothetical protein EJ08DRAFT_735528 [Tothia fuscella]|uniref:Uncharacterized protein n=1 Tax=Tothia fuscella TaxID=1048955 RepID=A0A9P4NNI0_9PEZI|nr:hypothetical protein EJ08DRAFT_735528 [Tothia fuscella]